MLRAAARRSEPSSALVNKLQFHCKAPLSLVLRPLQPSQRLATSTPRLRNSSSCPARPAAPARTAVACTRQRASAKVCSGRACAVQWKCVLECVPWARARVCSRARVCVCCAGAAERAYPRRKRPARCRAAQLPDLAVRERAPAMARSSRKLFF